MDTRLAGIIILLTLTSARANNCSDSEGTCSSSVIKFTCNNVHKASLILLTQVFSSFTVVPTRTYFATPFPGEFNGISTTPPTSPNCPNFGSEILCDEEGSATIILTDGTFGDEGGSIDPTKFIAWNDSSRISIQHVGDVAVAAVKQVNLFFYHEPASGIGLPEFRLSATISDTDLGNPLTYTILGNQDLSQDDAQVRNVTLALTELPTESANRFHIVFTLTDSIQQFAISELQLCGDQGNQCYYITPHSLHLLTELVVLCTLSHHRGRESHSSAGQRATGWTNHSAAC